VADRMARAQSGWDGGVSPSFTGGSWPAKMGVKISIKGQDPGGLGAGDQGSVRPADPRSRSAPLEHRELVEQDEDSMSLVVSGWVRSTIQLRSLENTR
jgi:hypothetical protein